MNRISIVLLSLSLAACARGGEDRPAAEPAAPAMPADTSPVQFHVPEDLDTLAQPAGAPVRSGQTSPAAEVPARGPAAPAATPASAADSAGAILERAAAKYQALRSLQADFTMTFENPLLRTRTEGRGTLYQKRPDRLLLRFSEPAGDVILSDGEYFWLYYPSVDREQVLRSPASAGGTSGVDLQAQFLGDPTQRFQYTLNGEEDVGGRKAWAFTLVPRERMGYRRLRVWIDQADHLSRRFEITEDNGSVRRFELRNLRADANLADNLFRFDVPAGVRVVTR